MDVLKEHFIPVLIMLIAAALFITLEFLFKHRIIKAGDKVCGTVSVAAVVLTILTGSALFIYLTVIGAGVEVMLPVILLILLGTML